MVRCRPHHWSVAWPVGPAFDLRASAAESRDDRADEKGARVDVRAGRAICPKPFGFYVYGEEAWLSRRDLALANALAA